MNKLTKQQIRKWHNDLNDRIQNFKPHRYFTGYASPQGLEGFVVYWNDRWGNLKNSGRLYAESANILCKQLNNDGYNKN